MLSQIGALVPLGSGQQVGLAGRSVVVAAIGTASEADMNPRRGDERPGSPALAIEPEPLLAPDPNAPAGPPPSFEASILDRAREELMNPQRFATVFGTGDVASGSDDVDAAAAEIGVGQSGNAFKRGMEEASIYDVPPSAGARVADTLGAVRMDAMAPTSTVDVSR